MPNLSIDSDLNALRAYLEDLEQYLKSDVIFWTAGSNLPALTIGSLLFLRRTLAARRSQLSSTQLVEVDKLESQASLMFSRWPANIEKKALREISSRLNVWASALDELGDNFAQKAKDRVYLALLMSLVARQSEAGPHLQRLNVLDSRLRTKLIKGSFVWEAGLAGAFPEAEFWFLYGQPRASE